jgi:hypothetical protein
MHVTHKPGVHSWPKHSAHSHQSHACTHSHPLDLMHAHTSSPIDTLTSHSHHILRWPHVCTRSKICCVCKAEPKYRCPGCSRRTCSLECVKQHKSTFACSGARARSKFAASVREFNDNTILSDYYLMEDAARLVGVSGRVGRAEKRRRVELNNNAMSHDVKALPPKLRKLVQVRSE